MLKNNIHALVRILLMYFLERKETKQTKNKRGIQNKV